MKIKICGYFGVGFRSPFCPFDPYRTILDVEIPDQGELILLDKGIVLGENDDMKGERIINVFYAAKDIAGLAESIE